MPNQKNCFVIAPIGDTESETRKRSDQVLKHLIKPAVLKCGYNAVRADEIDKPGRITTQVIQHVVNDPLVVADLTECNPNVFYELAIRHAIRKPYVQLMKKGEKIPFDVADIRTIYVDLHDLDSVEDAKTKIVEQITEFENGTSNIETPISVSLDLQRLQQSEKPEDRWFADLNEFLSTMSWTLGNIAIKVDSLENINEEIRRLQFKGVRHHAVPNPLLNLFSRRIHPAMMEDFLLSINSDHLKMLMLVCLLRDVFPWLYEIGIEAYRILESGKPTQAESHLIGLKHMIRFSLQSPWVSDFIEHNADGIKQLLERLEFQADQILLTQHSTKVE
ncbi:MAG: hypothetical protein OXC82_05135 [Rhodobacteraceae bacterium]|nr:hypothetical protein [Paracoccaceae bacterium]MCY4249806.1 hypothetical protein [Paracoccaceae bacterium]